jgi:hypothetical protein
MLACAAGIASAQAVGGGTWHVVVPPDERVLWRGIPAEEAAGAQSAMLYPAPSPGGLLVAILTHAALVQGGREAERRAQQQAADKVLEPFADTIAQMTSARLLDSAMPKVEATDTRLIANASMAGAGWVIELQPVFSLAPDQRTIVLDNAIKLHRPGLDSKPEAATVIRVISAPEPPPAADAATNRNAWLIEESAEMLAHSLDLAMRHATPPADAGTAKTLRYRFGDAEKMERGVPVASACNRLVLRTLRDGLMSVPLQPLSDAPACSTRYRLTVVSQAATAATKN